MIEWMEWRHDYTQFSTGHLTACVDKWNDDGMFRWRVTAGANLNYLGTDSVGVADTLAAAKLAAETFAREWVAAQAAALGDGGEWTSALPTVNGWYWVNTGAVVGLETTRPRLEFLTTVTALDYWGKPFQRWSVPLDPPPLPVAEVEE